MKELILYGTLGCHLCDQAYDLVSPLVTGGNYRLKKLDIADSAELLAMYDVRIPVLYRPDAMLELDWPFTEEIVQAFLAAEA